MEKTKKKKFSNSIKSKRVNHSHPIGFGGEDTELSLAIYMLGYKVQFIKQLKFIHKFEQKRLNQKYFLENVRGVCRSIPILEIYRLVIYKSNILFPKIFWILILFKIIIGCIIRFTISIVTNKSLKAKYSYEIIIGVISGFIFFNKSFDKIYNKLVQIKKSASNV